MTKGFVTNGGIDRQKWQIGFDVRICHFKRGPSVHFSWIVRQTPGHFLPFLSKWPLFKGLLLPSHLHFVQLFGDFFARFAIFATACISGLKCRSSSKLNYVICEDNTMGAHIPSRQLCLRFTCFVTFVWQAIASSVTVWLRWEFSLNISWYRNTETPWLGEYLSTICDYY